MARIAEPLSAEVLAFIVASETPVDPGAAIPSAALSHPMTQGRWAPRDPPDSGAKVCVPAPVRRKIIRPAPGAFPF